MELFFCIIKDQTFDVIVFKKIEPYPIRLGTLPPKNLKVARLLNNYLISNEKSKSHFFC